METNLGLTGMIMGVKMIKAAQQQERLALQLIQSATSRSEDTRTAETADRTVKTAAVEGERRIDIRV